jgi:ZIP family zinc transporter
MDDANLTRLILSGALAGIALPIGALLSRYERMCPVWLRREMRSSIMAFGGGALLAAVAVILVPEGLENVSNAYLSGLYFLLGGIVFCILDWFLISHGHPISNLVASLADFIPESIALGAVAAGGQISLSLVLLIVLQNIPEGYAARSEIVENSKPSKTSKIGLISIFSGAALMGPVAVLVGYYLFAGHAHLIGALTLFASGGILFLVFHDVAPESVKERQFKPALGCVLGFVLGMVGHELLK